MPVMLFFFIHKMKTWEFKWNLFNHFLNKKKIKIAFHIIEKVFLETKILIPMIFNTNVGTIQYKHHYKTLDKITDTGWFQKTIFLNYLYCNRKINTIIEMFHIYSKKKIISNKSKCIIFVSFIVFI